MSLIELERGKTILDTDAVEWEELAPPCEAEMCDPKNPAEWICKHRHVAGGLGCSAEGQVYLICNECYEKIKGLTAICMKCKLPASAIATERLK